MRKSFICGLISTVFMIVCLVGCKENNIPAPVTKKFDIITTSDTLDFECPTNAVEGQNLLFKVTLKETAVQRGYMLPTSLTTEIKVGEYTLNDGNYLYNADHQNNKGLYIIPAAFVFGDISLNIEGFTPSFFPIKLENSGTKLKLLEDDMPAYGVSYTNCLVLDVEESLLTRYALPQDIVIKCKDDPDLPAMTLIKGQYTYDNKSGYFYIEGEYINGEITVYGEAIDYDTKHVNISVVGDGSISFKIDGSDYVRLNEDGCTLKIKPISNNFEIPYDTPVSVYVNGKFANFIYDPLNLWEGTLKIDQIIDGDVAIFMNATRKKSVKVYASGDNKESVIASVNPDLYLGTMVCAYLAPLDPVHTKLPDTLVSVEVFNEETKIVILQPSQYFYDSKTGLFMVTNGDLVTDRIQIIVDAVPLN